MVTEKQFRQSPEQLLRDIFAERKKRNPLYSTRAFARDLGISQTLMSMMMTGKRPVTIKQATQISLMLQMNKNQAQQFIDSAIIHLPENAKAYKKLKDARSKRVRETVHIHYDIERFKVISQWHHIALLDLATTRGFQPQVTWIAKRLGISQTDARDALERLLALGLLVKKDGTIRKTSEKIYFATQKSEVAVRKFHKQMIELGSRQLDQSDPDSFSKREISGTTLAIRMDRLEDAKKRIRQFQRELGEFLTEGEGEEVYQLNVQFFPLSKELKENL